MAVVFLTLDEILEVHRDQIERYGGADGIHDVGLLHSALAQPSATFGGELLHKDVFEMAAAYLFHIVQNHPFVDGNKCVGAVAAVVFLELNDVELDVPEDAFESLVWEAARGQADKARIAEFFRRHQQCK